MSQTIAGRIETPLLNIIHQKPFKQIGRIRVNAMQIIFLLILALIPGILLLAYILYMDRKEPEPLGYVLFIMVLGALSCIVDAGSDYIGRGIKTSHSDAKKVTDVLNEFYSDFVFTPVTGRGAFGSEQSF